MKTLISILMLFMSITCFGQSKTQHTIELDCPTYTLEEQPNAAKTEQILAGCPATNNLFTFYAQNNAQRGVMFDLQAINAVTILCFDINLSVGTTNIDIYTKAGTHVGFENTPGSWVLIGSAPNVVSAGVNVATYIPIAVNTPMAAAATQAFYITRTTVGGPTVDYTNGVAVGNILAADANLRIREGTGKELLFSTNFTPRQYNGRIYYDLGNILPIELISFTGSKEYCNKNSLNWSTATEHNNDHFDIERCTDGVSFEKISEIKGNGNSQQLRNYAFLDTKPSTAINYYRLKQVDFDGNPTMSSIITIDNSCENNVRTLSRMNLMGQEVDETYSGLIFIYRSDNTIVKQLQNAN